MGSIVLTSLLTAAWLLVLLVALVVLVVVGVVLVRFLLVATVAASLWAERNGADSRTYWWPFRQGPRREPHVRAHAAPAPAGRPEPVRPEQVRPEQVRPEPVRPEPVGPEPVGPARSQPAPHPQPQAQAAQEARQDPRVAAGPRPRSDGGPLAGLRARMAPPAPSHEEPAPVVAVTEAPARPTRAEPPAARPEPAAAPAPEAEQPAPRQATRRPAARTRPAPPPEEDVDERESAIDRLFAPLAESDRTEPIPAVRPRTPRTPRQPRS